MTLCRYRTHDSLHAGRGRGAASARARVRPGGRAAAPQGQETVSLYANYLALAFGLLLGAQRAIQLLPFAAARAGFVWSTMCTLAAGACLIGYAANQAEPHALGDGTSLLITASIMSRARAGAPWSGRVGPPNPMHHHVQCARAGPPGRVG